MIGFGIMLFTCSILWRWFSCRLLRERLNQEESSGNWIHMRLKVAKQKLKFFRIWLSSSFLVWVIFKNFDKLTLLLALFFVFYTYLRYYTNEYYLNIRFWSTEILKSNNARKFTRTSFALGNFPLVMLVTFFHLSHRKWNSEYFFIHVKVVEKKDIFYISIQFFNFS